MISYEFKLGMKVALNGEKGVVVVSDFKAFDSLGIIRWDTVTDSDFEDWRGVYGTFVNMGGTILQDDYQFKFINDDGTLKNV